MLNRIRKIIIFSFLIFYPVVLLSITDKFSLEIKVKDIRNNKIIDPQKGIKGNVRLTHDCYSLYSYRVDIIAENKNDTTDIYIWNKIIFDSIPDGMVSLWGWNKNGYSDSLIICPNDTDTLKLTYFVRQNINIDTIDSLKIMSCLKFGSDNGNYDAGKTTKFKIHRKVIPDTSWVPQKIPEQGEVLYNVPVKNPEFLYKSGISEFDTISAEADIQDIYFFEANRPENMKIIVPFDILEDNIIYGFTVIASKLIDLDTLKLYSDFWYMKLDRNSPQGISEPKITTNMKDSIVTICWKGGYDECSWIQEYRLYRVMNQEETLIKIILGKVAKFKKRIDNYEYCEIDSELIPGAQYIVRGVDFLGNEGGGTISIQKVTVIPNPELLSWCDYKDTINNKYYNKGFINKIVIDTTNLISIFQFKYVFVKGDRQELEKYPENCTTCVDSGWIYKNNLIFNLKQGSGTYYYKVFLRNADSTTYAESEIATCTTDTTIPSNIKNLTAEPVRDSTRTGGGYIELNWKQAEDTESGIKGYHVFKRKFVENDSFKEISFIQNQKSTHYEDVFNRDTIQTEFIYKVIAEDNVGFKSDSANEASVKILFGPGIEWESPNNYYENYERIFIKYGSYNTENVEEYKVRVFYYNDKGKAPPPLFRKTNLHGERFVRIPLKPDSSSAVDAWVGIRYKNDNFFVWSNKVSKKKYTYIENKESVIPNNFKLYRNFPNPFNSNTTIIFDLPRPGNAKLLIYNIRGQNLAVLLDTYCTAGRYSVSWEGVCMGGIQATSGIYIFKLDIYDENNKLFSDKQKMLLLK